MDFNYQKDGDILYGVETFKFKYQEINAADITILNLLDDKQYAFEIRMTNENVPSDYKFITSADYAVDNEKFKPLDVEFKFVYNDKQEALQNAINIISAVMIKLVKK